MNGTLAHTIVRARDAEPSRYVLFLHGILGTRANWRGLARKLVEARPHLGAVLVDLRAHGDSKGLAGRGADDLEHSARDLLTLEAQLDLPVRGCLGHSFGGKVAMRYAGLRVDPLEDLVIVDSAPGRLVSAGGELDPRVSYTAGVIKALRGAPTSFDDREAFVAYIVSKGYAPGVAQWLAMNLGRADDGRRALGLDLDAIESLLASYYQEDLWRVVEQPRSAAGVHLILGGNSEVYGDSERARARIAAREHPEVDVRVIEGAGHWVHVDAPAELLSALVEIFTPR